MIMPDGITYVIGNKRMPRKQKKKKPDFRKWKNNIFAKIEKTYGIKRGWKLHCGCCGKQLKGYIIIHKGASIGFSETITGKNNSYCSSNCHNKMYPIN